ncbi:MAG: hypothetical protein J1F67_07720 [Muribaculaceae bacterium]|nr:hypothetical protein [Muribaculaceae bacterium]
MDTIAEISYWYNLALTYIVIGVTWLFDHFRDFAWIIKVAAISLTVSLWLILASLFQIFKKAWKNRKWKKVEKKLTEKYGETITYVLSPEAPDKIGRDEMLELLDIDPNEADPKKLLKDKREKLCMSRIIYRARISEEASVEGSRNLHVLLGIFGLIDFLEELIVKDNDPQKVESLLMLRAFKAPTNQWVANQLLNNKRHRVKRLAMYASILSSSNTDLGYFESEFFSKNFCMYDEIQLGFVLQRRKSARRKIPNLAHWAVMQEDPKAQAMFVRMMRQFNQAEYSSELEDLFQHNSDSDLIEEIARTWGYLKYTEGEELMRDMLLTQPDDGKVAILHALTRLNTGQSLNALLDGYRNSGTQHVKFEALRCIYWYGPEGRAKFEELRRTATERDKPLFEFFDNELTLKDLPLEKSAKYHSEYGDNLYSVV